jgi:hypothetical protein
MVFIGLGERIRASDHLNPVFLTYGAYLILFKSFYILLYYNQYCISLQLNTRTYVTVQDDLSDS